MRLRIITLITALLTFSHSEYSYAYNSKFALRAGASTASMYTRSFDNAKDFGNALGFATNVGYRYMPFELLISGVVLHSKNEEFTSITADTKISGEGNIRSALFGPIFRYYFPHQLSSNWFPYIGLGFLIAQHTAEMIHYNIQYGNFLSNYRIAYLSRGGILSIGAEELLTFKEQHPVFFEIAYSYQESSHIFLLDVSDFKKVETVKHEDTRQRVYSHLLLINLGILLF